MLMQLCVVSMGILGIVFNNGMLWVGVTTGLIWIRLFPISQPKVRSILYPSFIHDGGLYCIAAFRKICFCKERNRIFTT